MKKIKKELKTLVEIYMENLDMIEANHPETRMIQRFNRRVLEEIDARKVLLAIA